ncbi:MAG: prolyl oligopeptidase family serine peptidase [Acidobacteria bacterium]|nr:prolyl oligopeptidase family serine peptidase [Acidobacteriota bacterium]
MMRVLLALALTLSVAGGALQASAQSAAPALLQRTFVAPDGGRILYGLSVPPGYTPGEPRPLVVALHPGGPRTPYYGYSFLRGIVSPALRDLGAIMVAPDCPPPGSWSDPTGERAVLALVEHIRREYTIDPRRILVTGFSMGGRGTWFMATRHADLFTAAIPIAGAPGDEPLDRLGRIPMYVIHSRADDVVPFEPDARTTRELEKLGRTIRLEALDGIGHFEMGAYIDAFTRAGRWIAERWNR